MRHANLHDRNKAVIWEDGDVGRVVSVRVVFASQSEYCGAMPRILLVTHFPLKTSRELYFLISNLVALWRADSSPLEQSDDRWRCATSIWPCSSINSWAYPRRVKGPSVLEQEGTNSLPDGVWATVLI